MLAQVCSSEAACFSSGGHLASEELAKLQANPQVIFVNARGGSVGNVELISRVRDLATTDKAALKPILEALKFADHDEKSAIGIALGQAAQACLTTEANYSAEIQEALATTTDQTAILGFAAATGNVPIGATGGGGGGGAGGSTTGSGTASRGGTATGGGGTASPALISSGLSFTIVTTPTTGANNAVATMARSVSP